MLVDCPSISQYRNTCGLGPFIAAYRGIKPHISSVRLYALFLNDSNPEKMSKKSFDLYHMVLGWHLLMNIDI